jgi:hypothetical protein
MADWFYGTEPSNGEGPFDSDALKACADEGRLLPNHWVWRGNPSKARRAKEVPGLFVPQTHFRFKCHSCNTAITAEKRKAGQTARCPRCECSLVVPSLAPPHTTEAHSASEKHGPIDRSPPTPIGNCEITDDEYARFIAGIKSFTGNIGDALTACDLKHRRDPTSIRTGLEFIESDLRTLSAWAMVASHPLELGPKAPLNCTVYYDGILFGSTADQIRAMHGSRLIPTPEEDGGNDWVVLFALPNQRFGSWLSGIRMPCELAFNRSTRRFTTVRLSRSWGTASCTEKYRLICEHYHQHLGEPFDSSTDSYTSSTTWLHDELATEVSLLTFPWANEGFVTVLIQPYASEWRYVFGPAKNIIKDAFVSIRGEPASESYFLETRHNRSVLALGSFAEANQHCSEVFGISRGFDPQRFSSSKRFDSLSLLQQSGLHDPLAHLTAIYKRIFEFLLRADGRLEPEEQIQQRLFQRFVDSHTAK